MSIDCVQTTARSAWFSGRMWRRAQQCLKCHDNFINFPFFLFGPKSCCLLCDQQPNSIFIFSHVLRVCIFLTLSLLLLQSNDDKEKANSPFESNGIKKDDQGNATNGVAVNGIDDDKGFKWVLPRFFYSSLSLMLLYLYSDFFCVQQRISHLYLYLKIEVCVKWKCLFGILCRLSDDAEAGSKQTLWILTILQCGTECCPHTNSTQFSPSCCSVSARRSQWETNPVCIWNARAEIFPHLSAFVRQIR